ncbi:diaminopimelate epimerase [bacterium]|nr:diaminopimelate epimerase [bacterium]
MPLMFWKMTGAGNDFVALSNLDGAIEPDEGRRADLIRRLCARRIGVGADGVLILEPSESCDFRMRYYNADGGEAETCGNGARCIARVAKLLDIAGDRMRFDTSVGPYNAEIFPDSVRVSMGDAFDLRMGIRPDGVASELIPADSVFGREGTVDFVNSGVPHVVLHVEDLENTPVVALGRVLRYHAAFAPAGTNVDFIQKLGDSHFAIRTYERGVEDETLACGTGCIASAVIAQRRGLAVSPTRFTTRSGVDLTVHFDPTVTGARQVQLQGEARLVYRGELAE